MKQFKYFPLLIILMLIFLSACSDTATETATNEAGSAGVTDISGTSSAGTGTDAVSQLIFGTLMLADSDNAVTVEQAKTMLPLWQLYQSMASEDATASEELDAIINQIKKVFTEDQLAEMAAFDYSNPMEMMTQLGIEMGATSEDGTEITVPENFTMGDMPIGDGAGGGFDAGNIPSGGGGGMGGGDFTGMTGGDGTYTEIDPQVMSTAQAARGDGGNNRQSLMFLSALINYLEEVSGS